MKVILLSAGDNPHTEKIANELSKEHSVFLVSLHPLSSNYSDRVVKDKLTLNPGLGYIFSFFELRKIIKEVKPDILNAHYASGYGLLASLSGFEHAVLSLWGSDIYIFPRKSFLHKWLIGYNIRKSKVVASTSRVMLDRARTMFNFDNYIITPFGVDTKKFSPKPKLNIEETVTIGTVKSLKKIYGIDILIKSYALVLHKLDNSKRIRLRIAGDGPEMDYLKSLSVSLGISESVEFIGRINNSEVPDFLNELDVFCSLSHSESFGVSALEASSCGLPVVTSRADGFEETVIDNVTGYRVEHSNLNEVASILYKLIIDRQLRMKLGSSGRKFVCEKFNINSISTNFKSAYDMALSVEK